MWRLNQKYNQSKKVTPFPPMILRASDSTKRFDRYDSTEHCVYFSYLGAIFNVWLTDIKGWSKGGKRNFNLKRERGRSDFWQEMSIKSEYFINILLIHHFCLLDFLFFEYKSQQKAVLLKLIAGKCSRFITCFMQMNSPMLIIIKKIR